VIADDESVRVSACSRFFVRPIGIRCQLVAAAIVLAWGVGSAPWARAQNEDASVRLPRIEVESQGSVSVVGSSESLRAVIAALCETSDVELRQYRAPDRPISARYEGASLRHVLERLLRQESFMLGFSARASDGEPEIAWLSVIGTEGQGASAAAGGPAAGRGATARSGSIFPIALIDNENAGTRVAAGKTYARRLDAEDALRKRLLDGSIQELADQLSGHRYARAFLQTVRTTVRNPQARAKINSLLSRVK